MINSMVDVPFNNIYSSELRRDVCDQFRIGNANGKWKMENGLKLNYNTKYKDSMVYSTVLEYKSLMHHMIVSIFRFESLAQCSLSTRQILYKLFVSSPHRWMEQGIHLKMKIADGSHSII